MKSRWLERTGWALSQYKYLLLYGAGGVTKDFLCLFAHEFPKESTFIAVTELTANTDLMYGYRMRLIYDFVDFKEDTYVILSTMPCFYGEIISLLNELGFQHYQCIDQLIKKMYDEIWMFPVQGNKIVLSNFSWGRFGCNPKYIALELLKRNTDVDLVWITKKEDVVFPDGIRTVIYGTYEHYYELGTSHIWIDNQHKNFFSRKRDGQIYIQTWHGGGPLKRIEFDSEQLPKSYLELCELNSEMEDIVVSPSRFNSEVYRRAFHYHGEILECGYPRNDIFFQTRTEENPVRELFRIKRGESIVLIAPTFRASRIVSRDKLQINLRSLKKALEIRFKKIFHIFIRFHPEDVIMKKYYESLDGWINVSNYNDVQELMVASDVLVTDYSSVMWDFSLQRKPVFLFHPDLSFYEKERGYYLPFHQMPYIEAFTNEELQKKILSFDEKIYTSSLEKFLEKYGTFDKGTAAYEIGNRIMKMIGEL